MNQSQGRGVHQLLERRGDAAELLTSMIRGIFPHPQAPEDPYRRVAEKVLHDAADDAWLAMTLSQGLDSLDARAGGDFRALSPADAYRVLVDIQGTPFFSFVRKTAVENLYEDEEMWTVLGYEGPSFDKGGYVNRGFDDLDWVPDPRVEEYADAELVDVVEVGDADRATSTTTTSTPGGDAASGADSEAAAAPVGQVSTSTSGPSTGRSHS